MYWLSVYAFCLSKSARILSKNAQNEQIRVRNEMAMPSNIVRAHNKQLSHHGLEFWTRDLEKKFILILKNVFWLQEIYSDF